MDFNQNKLTREEWNSVEIKLPNEEINIIKMIVNGFNNVNIEIMTNYTIIMFLKIEVGENIDSFIYNHYFKKFIDKTISKYSLDFSTSNNDKKLKRLNTADMIRIQKNNPDNLNSHDTEILEYVIISIINKILKYHTNNSKKWIRFYYTLYCINNMNLSINIYILELIQYIIDSFKKSLSIEKLVENASSYIENNNTILAFKNNSLYKHQKDIFNIFNNDDNNHPKLVLYIAPTATGKTLTPIGLASKYKVIFVCAARHVGISLAKSAINANKKVAFAFGCKETEDIRLHYHAAASYVKHKSGSDIKYKDGKKKVDNSDGSNVEIMICDLKSYEPAMLYMIAFNENKENIITFWDEPTISLDYENHDIHDIIANNWSKNLIPNVILSSATLPKQHEIYPVIQSFKNKFSNKNNLILYEPTPKIYSIESHDCFKTIPIINSDSYAVLPHKLFDNFVKMQYSIEHIKNNKTLLRYFDIDEISKFIIYTNKNNLISNPELHINNYFTSLNDVTIVSLKLYYLEIIENIDENDWESLYTYFQNNSNIKFNNGGINITTKDAQSLTDGPTIFIAENVDKIAKFCVQQSNIPQFELKNIVNCISFNNTINEKISRIEKDLEDALAKYEGQEKKVEKESFTPAEKALMVKLKDLNLLIKSVKIESKYVPNSIHHLEKWNYTKNDNNENIPYTSDISEKHIEEIMAIKDIEDIWKILLILGIGLFSRTKPIAYTELVKKLADEQKLYLIIANGDYIYGTNYQFCHQYLSKDLSNMTQEKIIQAMGRIGRNKLQQNYSCRFRDNSLFEKLFLPEENKIEVYNMNRLFT